MKTKYRVCKESRAKGLGLWRVWAVCLCLVAPSLVADTVVLPRGFGDDPPHDNGLTMFSQRFQQVIDAGKLVDVMPEGAWLSGVAFNDLGFGRPGQDPSWSVVVDYAEISVSTTSRRSNQLLEDFNANVGPDVTTVLAASNIVLTLQTGTAFDAEFRFEEPYLYDPREGNLLLDVTVFGTAVGEGQRLDLLVWSSDFDGMSMIVAGGYQEPFGFTDPFAHPGAPLVRIEFSPIPEPSSALLLCIGIVALIAWTARARVLERGRV